MAVAEKIRTIRQQKQMTQAQLANATGMDPFTISRYETGHTKPSLEALKKIANSLEVSIDYLVYENVEILNDVIKDKELFGYFKKVDRMNEKDKAIIKNMIEGIAEKY